MLLSKLLKNYEVKLIPHKVAFQISHELGSITAAFLFPIFSAVADVAWGPEEERYQSITVRYKDD